MGAKSCPAIHGMPIYQLVILAYLTMFMPLLPGALTFFHIMSAIFRLE